MSENANTTYSRLVMPADCTAALAPGTASILAAASVEAADVRLVVRAVERYRAQLARRLDVLAERGFRQRIGPDFARVGFGQVFRAGRRQQQQGGRRTTSACRNPFDWPMSASLGPGPAGP